MLIIFPYSGFLKTGIILSLFLILTQALFTTTNIIFQVKLRYDLSTIGYVTGYITILVCIILFSILKMNIIWVSLSYVFGGLVTFIINIYFSKRLGINVVPKIDFNLWKYLFLQSLPLGLMFLFSQINFKSDSILISVLNLPVKYGLNNTESVAVYSLPYKIFEVALVVPTFLMNAVYPIMVKHYMQSKEKLKITFIKTVGFLFFTRFDRRTNRINISTQL